MADFFKEPETLPECDERDYWRKRFNFASWLFLFLALYAILTDNLDSAIIAITVSLGFRIFDTVCAIRHMKWHVETSGRHHE